MKPSTLPTLETACAVARTLRPGQFPGITFQQTGGDDGGELPPNETDDDDADEDGGGDNDPPAGDDKKGKPIQMDSKALNKRLERAKGAERTALLKDLGFEDMEAAKAAISKLQELENASLTEKERLEAENTRLKKEKADLLAVAQRIEAEKKADDADRFLERTAIKFGADEEELDITLAKLKKHIADNFEDDEDVTEEDVTTFLEELRTKKPSLFVAKETPASNGNKKKAPAAPQPNSPAPAKPISDMTREEFRNYKLSIGLTV